MKKEVVPASFYSVPVRERNYPKIQILSIVELLYRARVEMPLTWGPFKQAQKADEPKPTQGE